ncbi:MAG: hypothetical protein JXA98_03290 [Methanosarcinaceae archaeon]|nr:hypothetical protein [Methanosarcinaceae archaeon]
MIDKEMISAKFDIIDKDIEFLHEFKDRGLRGSQKGNGGCTASPLFKNKLCLAL